MTSTISSVISSVVIYLNGFETWNILQQLNKKRKKENKKREKVFFP